MTGDLGDVVVTSKHRSEADQERLAEQGYRPHPRSQHKLGLAWDCVAPARSLEVLRERARAEGFVALPLSSPVTGTPYLHVQRFARSPGLQAVVAAVEPEPTAAEPVPEPTPAIPPVAAEPEVEPPRPLGGAGFEFPRRLLRKKAEGRIVLLLDLSDQGEVLDVEVASSELPRFDEFVANEVLRWRFAPRTQDGRPIAARARLPISIRIE
jgi:TonB family protein